MTAPVFARPKENVAFDPNRFAPKPLFESPEMNVITSYSIHYTKLYECNAVRVERHISFGRANTGAVIVVPSFHQGIFPVLISQPRPRSFEAGQPGGAFSYRSMPPEPGVGGRFPPSRPRGERTGVPVLAACRRAYPGPGGSTSGTRW